LPGHTVGDVFPTGRPLTGESTRGGVRRPLIGWLRRHPQVADALLGAALFVFAVITVAAVPSSELPTSHAEDPDLLGFVLLLVMTLALTWRRRAPVTVLAVITAADVAYFQLGSSATPAEGLAFFIATYTIATYTIGSWRTAWRGMLVILVMVLIYSTSAFVKDGSLSDLTGGYIAICASWAIGRAVALRRAYIRSLEERAAQLEHLREAELRDVVHEERARIARELHDVVAHHVSVMTVQASAALRQLDRDPARSREALTSVEEVGRTAMSEMRRMVGVLRELDAPTAPGQTRQGQAPDEMEDLMPQPAIADLPGLVDQMTQAGLPVTLTVEGSRTDLSPGVELTAYRVVQEALTNTLKHAGPTEAGVVLRYGTRDVLVQVSDQGRGLAANLGLDPDGSRPFGHGLLGMRERVELYGGALYAGPRRGGGYEVRARIPVGQASG
jgi:signal transduction histidine kinase